MSLLRCTPRIIECEGLSLIEQVSSNHFRELNISLGRDYRGMQAGLATYQQRLTALDDHLQLPNFAHLEVLAIGLMPDDTSSMATYFPRTARRGLLRRMSEEETLHVPGLADRMHRIASFD